MHIVVISDTHGEHARLKLPENIDLLIHCGDFTYNSTDREVLSFFKWLSRVQAKYKIVVPGNHDDSMSQSMPHLMRYLPESTLLLVNQGIRLPEGLNIYGSPFIPRNQRGGFGLPRGSFELKQNWEKIPDSTDILVTHCPPYGILDANKKGESVGCEFLRKKVKAVKPSLHVFGHIHESFGTLVTEHTDFGNAAFLHKRSLEQLTGNEYLEYMWE